MNVELIVDSTVDVPEHIRSRLTVVPLTIHFGQEAARARLRTKPALEKRRCKTGYSRLDSNHPHEYSGIRHRRR